MKRGGTIGAGEGAASAFGAASIGDGGSGAGAAGATNVEGVSVGAVMIGGGSTAWGCGRGRSCGFGFTGSDGFGGATATCGGEIRSTMIGAARTSSRRTLSNCSNQTIATTCRPTANAIPGSRVRRSRGGGAGRNREALRRSSDEAAKRASLSSKRLAGFTRGCGWLGASLRPAHDAPDRSAQRKLAPPQHASAGQRKMA